MISSPWKFWLRCLPAAGIALAALLARGEPVTRPGSVLHVARWQGVQAYTAPTNLLRGEWLFNSTNDTSGLGNHGTLRGTARLVGGVLILDGGGYFEIPDAPAFTLTNFTLATWFYTTSTNQQTLVRNRVLGALGTASGFSHEIQSLTFNANNLVEDTGTQSITTPNSSGSMTNGAWTLAILKRTNLVNLTMVENLAVVARATNASATAAINTTNNLFVGSISSNRNTIGGIGSVRIWGGELTPQQEQDLFYAGPFP